MNSIYHVTFAAITDYLAYGLQIETCLENNFQVKILDISKLFNFPKPHHSVKYQNLVVVIESYAELEQYILNQDSKKSIFNVQITYEWRFRKIFRMLAKLNQYNFSIFLLGQLPFHTQSTLWQKVFTTEVTKVPKKTITQIISRILFKLNLLQSQSILFYAGESLANVAGKKFKFPINFFDYDRYLENPKTQDNGYAVFLDDGLFQHPDDKIVGNVVTAELQNNYRDSLNNFFDFVEESMKIKIIVSPHPKVSYPKDFFGKREVIINKSRELVQDCRLVLCHCSSSISYAVCYSKPLFFLTDKNIINFSKKFQPFDQYIHNFARHLNRPVFNLSEPLLPWDQSLNTIDQNAYDKFKLDYLTTNETKEILTKDIVIKDLLKILQ